jgi:hypothetical protein
MAKPASGTALNTGHALAPNFACWAFLEGSGTSSADSAGSRTLTLNGGTSFVTWTTDANGDPCLSFPNASAAPVTMVSAVQLAGTSSWSIAWRWKKTADNNQGTLFGTGNNGDPDLFLAYASAGFEAIINTGSSSYNAFDFTSPTSWTTEANYVITFDHAAGSNRFRLYKNGTEVASSPVNGLATMRLFFSIIGSGRDGISGTLALEGKLSYLYVWDARVLSSGEAGSLNTDPYAMFGAGGGGGLPIPVAMNLYRQQRNYRRTPAGLWAPSTELLRAA